MIVGHRTRLSPNVHICDLVERGDLYELRNLATKWYMLIVIKKIKLNENSVEPFFHFNAFWKRSNALQIMHLKTLTTVANENEMH